MVAVADLTRVDEWMNQVLTGDLRLEELVGGRIYSDEAPQGAAAPMVVYAFLGGADKLLTSRSRLTSALYLVRAIGDGSSYDAIEPIADRIEAVLTIPDAGTIIREVRLMSCQREQPHMRKDSAFGKPTVYLGGFYRVRYQPVDQ